MGFKVIKFQNTECILRMRPYPCGRIGIELMEYCGESPNLYEGENVYAVATINLPDSDLHQNELGIKNYSENKGMLGALVNHKVVINTGNVFPSGYVQVPICTLNKDIFMEYRLYAVLMRNKYYLVQETQDLWCECDFYQEYYVPLGEHPDCNEEHWRCGKC